ncbi:MAG: HlyD family efflux transporter periplasmic adaptor subunit [Rhodospirillaceae bacterium]
MTAAVQPLRQLPPLRQDLVLMAGARTRAGEPTWLLYDPARHRYMRFDQDGFEILSRWDAGTPDALLAWLARETTVEAEAEDIDAMAGFLERAHLLDGAGAPVTPPPRPDLFAQLLHGYLFFRIPLVRPARFLPALARATGWLFSPHLPWLILGLAMIGGFLASRQWDAFLGTFTAYATWQGAASILIGIVLSKVVHELGHALTLYRFGGRVPTMGVAFLVMFPVPYTDTGDAWRLASKSQRLRVGVAGVVAELLLAAVALVLWSFVPDGPVRATLFVLATTVWVGTVLINASPFMRFDGYYLLSDLLEVPNLQGRAFALGRWRLRRALLGMDDPPPEALQPRLRRVLIAYAYATWVYRLILFLGIALLVYHFFFKILGIVLFLVEIWAFIARPVASELAVWWKRRRDSRWTRGGVLAAATGAVLLAACLVPWRSAIQVPAVLNAAVVSPLHTPVPGRIEEILVAPGQQVAAGKILIRLSSPDLAFRAAQAERDLDLAKVRYDQALIDGEGIQHAAALRQEVLGLHARLAGLRKQQDRFALRAPIDGRVVDLPPALRPGLWVNQDVLLGRVVAARDGRLTLYIPEDALGQVRAGNVVTFRAQGRGDIELRGPLGALPPVALDRLDDVLSASVGGGGVAVRQEADGSLRPTSGTYQATVALPGIQVLQQHRGAAIIEGQAETLVARVFRRVASVILRESGF